MNADQTVRPNDDYLSAKGYNTQFELIDKDLMKSRIYMGI